MSFAKLAICLLAASLLLCPVQAEWRTRVTKIDACAFGAVPNDGKSDTKAVLAAVEECRKHKSAVLRFAEGTYDFFGEDSASGTGPLLNIADLKNVTIDGGGSTFMFHSYNVGGFHLANCSKVTLRNFTIDYARPPFSLGRIVASGEKSFDVEVEKNYPVAGNEGVAAFMIWDPVNRHALAEGMEYYGSIPTELVRPQVIRLNAGHDFKFAEGLWMLLRHKVYGPAGIIARRCNDVRVENVTIHTVPGMGMIANTCNNVTVKRFRLVPKPESGHPMTATADGLHFSGNTGLITIEDCEFEGMGDDAANIKTGLYSKVTEKIDKRTVLAVHNLKLVDAPSPGDKIEIAHHADMLTYATAVADSVETLKDGVLKIRFKAPLPEELQVGDLLGNATRVAKVRIKNVSVRNNRARGFLLQNRDVLVENCKFENCTSGGIWVLTEVFVFYESITSRDVIVRNCTFDNCGYWPGPCVLGVLVMRGTDSFGERSGAHKNVLFEGNVIRGADNSGIFVNAVDGAVVRNNIIEQVCRKPTHKHGSAAIYVMGSSNVVLEGNKCEASKQGAGCKEVFAVGPGCDKDSVKLADNIGFSPDAFMQ